jgi:hypothetical protein
MLYGEVATVPHAVSTLRVVHEGLLFLNNLSVSVCLSIVLALRLNHEGFEWARALLLAVLFVPPWAAARRVQSLCGVAHSWDIVAFCKVSCLILRMPTLPSGFKRRRCLSEDDFGLVEHFDLLAERVFIFPPKSIVLDCFVVERVVVSFVESIFHTVFVDFPHSLSFKVSLYPRSLDFLGSLFGGLPVQRHVALHVMEGYVSKRGYELVWTFCVVRRSLRFWVIAPSHNFIYIASMSKNQAHDIDKILKANNHYEVLGVCRGANKTEIRQAYKDQALKFHPDKNAIPRKHCFI